MQSNATKVGFEVRLTAAELPHRSGRYCVKEFLRSMFASQVDLLEVTDRPAFRPDSSNVQETQSDQPNGFNPSVVELDAHTRILG